MPELAVEPLLDCGNLLGESIVWEPGRGELLWVNIHDGELWSCGPAGDAVQVRQLPERVGCIGLRRGGGLARPVKGGGRDRAIGDPLHAADTEASFGEIERVPRARPLLHPFP